MRILITGGNGFVGKPVVDYLLENGHEVRVLDISAGNLTKHSNLDVVIGSIEDERLVFEATKNIDTIYHFALAFPDDMKEFFYANINGTLNLLESAIKNRIKHFLFASSGAVYGKPRYSPIDEEHPCHPEEIPSEKLPPGVKAEYGLVKLITERLCLFYHYNHDLPVTVFRMSGVFGGKYNYVKPPGYRFIQESLRGETIVVKEKGGGQWIHVEDVARAFLSVTLNEKTYGQVFNLSGFFISDRELAEIIVKLTKSKSKINCVSGESPSTRWDLSKLRKVLGFQVKYGKKELKESLRGYIRQK